MNRTAQLTLAAAIVFSSACSRHKVYASWEPNDPNGSDTVVSYTDKDDALPKLLKHSVLHFGFDDATLTASDQKMLQRLAEALKARPWVTIRVGGHCDERGTAEYNMALGQRRADATRNYLVALGVNADAVDTVSFGAEVPVMEGATEEAWAENRRAEFNPGSVELYGYVGNGGSR
jgi:peptidoglycan-associated lipoprotein